MSHNFLLTESTCPKIFFNYIQENNKKNSSIFFSDNFYELYIIDIIRNKYTDLYLYLINKYKVLFDLISYDASNIKETILIELIKNNCNDAFKYTINNVFSISSIISYKDNTRVTNHCIEHDNLELFLFLYNYLDFNKRDIKNTIMRCLNNDKKESFLDKIKSTGVIANFETMINTEKEERKRYIERNYGSHDSETNIEYNSDSYSYSDSDSDSDSD